VKTFAEILKRAPARRIVTAPSPEGAALPDNLEEELLRRGHAVTAPEGGEEHSVKEACRLLKNRQADMLLQGNISLQRLFDLLEAEGILGKNPCFVSVFEDRVHHKLLLMSDTYMHDFPDLQQKIACLNRAIELAEALSMEKPKVAVLSAIETINPAIPSTSEAAVLSKMSDRGQLNALVEGPLDIDAVIQREAAELKGIKSPVPGDPDIILCPDIETAFALSQAFTFIGSFPTAGVLLGTFSPVIINPRLIPPAHKAVEVAIHALMQKGGDTG